MTDPVLDGVSPSRGTSSGAIASLSAPKSQATSKNQNKAGAEGAQASLESGLPADAIRLTRDLEAARVDLSAAARERAEGQEAASTLEQGMETAEGEADSLQRALDTLKDSFEELLRQFGLSEEDSRKGALAGRQAVREAAREAAARIQGTEAPSSVRVTTEQTLVVEAREVSFTLTREDDEGNSTTVTASVQSVSVRYEETTTLEAQWEESDPLILDLDGNGLDLAPGTEGNRFDMDGDGVEEETAWVAGNDAFLAMDRDGDGQITSGKELFGDQHGAKDGFEELAKLDSNGDGALDANDSQWGALLVMTADGSTRSLEEAGVTRIALDAIVPMDERLGNAGRLTGISHFDRTDGGSGLVGNMRLDVRV